MPIGEIKFQPNLNFKLMIALFSEFLKMTKTKKVSWSLRMLIK